MPAQLLNDYETIRENRREIARQWGDFYRSGCSIERPTITLIKIKETPGFNY